MADRRTLPQSPRSGLNGLHPGRRRSTDSIHTCCEPFDDGPRREMAEPAIVRRLELIESHEAMLLLRQRGDARHQIVDRHSLMGAAIAAKRNRPEALSPE